MNKCSVYSTLVLVGFLLALGACGQANHASEEQLYEDSSRDQEEQDTGADIPSSDSSSELDEGDDTTGGDEDSSHESNTESTNPAEDTNTDADDSTTTEASECSGVFDTVTRLCWQDPTYFGATNHGINWVDSMAYCSGLDEDGATDWYMPNVDEVRTIIKGCESTATGGACTIVDGSPDTMYSEACDGCGLFAGPADSCYWPDHFSGLCPASMWLWTSSESVDPGFPFFFDPSAGRLGRTFDTLSMGVRCVRKVP